MSLAYSDKKKWWILIILVLCVLTTVLFLSIQQKKQHPWQIHIIDDSFRGADGHDFVDANGDGWLDVVSAYEPAGQTLVCIHPGPSKVRDRWNCVAVGLTPDVEGAAFADIDQDGSYDIISAMEGDTKRIQIHWAPSDAGQYLQESAWQTDIIPASQTGALWFDVTPWQIDGKHGIDFVGHAMGVFGWFQSPSNPRDMKGWKFHPFRTSSLSLEIELYDMDGDGDIDITSGERLHGDHDIDVMAGERFPNESPTMTWLENPGANSPLLTQPWTEHAIGEITSGIGFHVLDDMDNDGLTDVVAVGVGTENTLNIFRRLTDDGTAWEENRVAWQGNPGALTGIATGDLNCDGKKDIAASCGTTYPCSVIWLSAETPLAPTWKSYQIHATDPWWKIRRIFGPRGKYDRIILYDIDGDGDLDVTSTEQRIPLGIIWWENPSTC